MVWSALSRSKSRWWKSGNASSGFLLHYRSRSDSLSSSHTIVSHGILIWHFLFTFIWEHQIITGLASHWLLFIVLFIPYIFSLLLLDFLIVLILFLHEFLPTTRITLTASTIPYLATLHFASVFRTNCDTMMPTTNLVLFCNHQRHPATII